MPPASLSHADLPIRRGCVIVALMALGAMAALAHEPVVALRLGAEVAAFLTLGLVLAARQAPRRVTALAPARLLRARLLWHAERVSLAALALWVGALAAWLLGH